jgi:transporter family-2 protein
VSRVRALIPAAAAVGVGVLTALQAKINGELAVLLGSGVQAAVVSFGSGFVVLCVLVLVVPALRQGLLRLPGEVRAGRLAWWACLGGIGGGFFVAVQSFAVPLVGVAVFTVGVVGGQTASSLGVDRAGLGPAGRTPVTGARVLAAVIAVLAVTVAVSDRLGGSLAGGAGLARCSRWWRARASPQQAINGRVAVATRQPVVAAWVNFVVGTAMLVAVLLIGSLALGNAVAPLPSGPWWVYLGRGHRRGLHRRGRLGGQGARGCCSSRCCRSAASSAVRCCSTWWPPQPGMRSGCGCCSGWR